MIAMTYYAGYVRVRLKHNKPLFRFLVNETCGVGPITQQPKLTL